MRKSYSDKTPVVIVPGMFSSKLVCQGNDTSIKHLRGQPIWGGLALLRLAITNKESAYKCLALTDNHADNKGFTLRPSKGAESVGFPGFPLWDALLKKLKKHGLSSSCISMAPYDWRIPIPELETRDGYFTHLMTTIEQLYEIKKVPVTLISHSLGSVVTLYFLHWVSIHSILKQRWVPTYLHAVINIAGPFLGSPKSLSAALLGSTAEIASLGPFARELVEKGLNLILGDIKKRIELVRSWGSVSALIPRGGTRIWSGSGRWNEHLGKFTQKIMFWVAAVARWDIKKSLHPTFYVANTKQEATSGNEKSLYGSEAVPWVQDEVSKQYCSNVGLAMSQSVYDPIDSDTQDWLNPLQTPLPTFTLSEENNTFTIYSFYGYGMPTEVAYHIHQNQDGWSISTFLNEKEKVHNGIEYSDGDETVPLISLGYMSRKGWKHPSLNPSGVSVVTREYKHHDKTSKSHDKSKESGQHVAILWNKRVIRDILTIVSQNTLKEKVTSQIDTLISRTS